MNEHRKAASAVFLLCLSILLGGVPYLAASFEDGTGKDSVFINEVCSWNETVLKDSEEEFCDYIELYNASGTEISIEGWHLSDESAALQKCRLEGSLGPGERRIIYADGEGMLPDAVSFRIGSEGETVFLSDAGGNLVDSISVPALDADTVYARVQDGQELWARMEPSPGAPNGEYAVLPDKTLNAPVFSAVSGFYEEPFLLKLRAEENETIFYTTDGSTPTEDSRQYEDGIMIEAASSRPNVWNSVQNVVENWKEYTPSEELADKATVIRAMTADAQGNISEVATATYFVGLDGYENTDVLSIAADPEDLFGEDGIFVTGREYDEWYLSDPGTEEEAPLPNFRKRGREWEAKASIQLFESGKEVLNQTAGLRVQGASTRGEPKKRFKIYAREEYSGSEYFDLELFDKKSHSFLLRHGFIDAFAPYLVEERDLSVQHSRPVAVFLNGEFWYGTYMREKYDKYYLQETYGVDADNVVIIKDGNVNEGEVEYVDEYQELLDWIRENEDLPPEEAYRILDERIDMQSYIDFLCANIYLCNMDTTQNANYMLWRTMKDEGTEYGDCKWRWFLYDLDSVEWLDPTPYGNYSSRTELAFFPQGKFENGRTPLKDHSFLRALRHDDVFRERFVMSFLDMANTCFAVEEVEEKLEAWGEDLSWNEGFFAHRAEYIIPNVAGAFHLSGVLEEIQVEVSDAQGGYVKVNTCTPDLSEGPWTGRYFIDYPVKLQAVAAEGYRFAGWKGSYITDEEEISADLKEGSVSVTAVFEKI